MNGIWAIVLAAGESGRMGSPKMLLPYNDVTVIEQVILNLLDSDIDRVVVVLGAGREEIMSVTRRYDVFHCYNEDYKTGMLSSVKCGFYSIPGAVQGAHHAR
jgi:molybdenum cofactor cytidylyltransferase